LRLLPSYLPVRRQQRLKPPSGAARTQVIPAELLDELFLSVNDLSPAFHFGL